MKENRKTSVVFVVVDGSGGGRRRRAEGREWYLTVTSWSEVAASDTRTGSSSLCRAAWLFLRFTLRSLVALFASDLQLRHFGLCWAVHGRSENSVFVHRQICDGAGSSTFAFLDCNHHHLPSPAASFGEDWSMS